MSRNRNCKRCPLYETTSNVCIWGVGDKQADIMLIGEAPGAEEEEQDKPFVGAAGRLIDRLLVKAGLERPKVYTTNIVKCRPPGNRDPDKSEAAACFKYLAQEIAQVAPKVIVLVGLQATKAFTTESTLERARGKLLTVNSKIRVGDAKVIATYHPAAGMHNPGKRQMMEDAIVEDFKYAQNLVNPISNKGERTLLPEGYSSEELITALYSLRKARTLACDLEWLTTPQGKFAWPWTPTSALSISLTARIDDTLKTVAFAWPPKSKGTLALKTFLSNRSLIFHNAMADMIWLLSLGFDPNIAGDSMLLSYLLDEHRRAGLKGLAPLLTGVESGWEQKPWHRRPATAEGWLELLTYNAGDTENTLLLHEALITTLEKLPETRRGNLSRVYTRLLLPAVKPFARMALAGTPINRVKLLQQIKDQRTVYHANIDLLAHATNMRADAAERLANSPAQVGRYAREAFGLEIDSTREEELGPYAAQYAPLRYIKAIKHARKLLSTYLEPWERLTRNDSRLHSVYLLGATRTGRLSAEIEEGGSLLLTPREEFVRDLISAEDDEYEILSADYSQIELRIIAWLAPEHNMRRMFNAGADLHKTTAAFMIARRSTKLTVHKFWRERKQWEQRVTKEERQKAKGINFGFDFGMQEEHFTSYALNNYGVVFTPQEAHEAREGYFELWDDLPRWHERAMTVDMDRGYTVTPFGRYRFGLDATQSINTPIQSTASDLSVLALTVVDERIQSEMQPGDAELIGFVHDCLLVRARKSKRKQIERIIQESMEHPNLQRVGIKGIPVPLVAEVKHGESWAKAS